METERAINSLQEYVRQTVLQNLNSYSLKFLTKDITPFRNYSVLPLHFHMKWAKDYELIEFDEPYRIYTHQFIREFSISSVLRFRSNESGLIADTPYNSKCLCEAVVNFHEHVFNFEIFDEEKRFLRDFNKKVLDLSKKHKIIGFDEEDLKIDNQSIHSYFTDITRKTRSTPFAVPFHDFNVIDDIIRCSQDIRFIISQVLLYNPYVSNYMQGKSDWHGKVIFRYFPTMFDKRFFMNCGLAVELIYNFWDKIGDLINDCFGVITKGNVYFGSVIKRFPNGYHSSPNYQWLVNFVDTDFQSMLDTRNEIVHYSAIESKFFENWIDNNNNETEIMKLQERKEQLIPFLINQNQKMLEGFEKATKLIDEIM